MSMDNAGHILGILRSDIANIATMIPAIVLKHDTTAQTVDVELVVKRPYFGKEDPTERPIRLTKVPLVFPQGSDWVMAGPLKKGDAVLIHCSMFDCDTWLVGNKNTVYPAGSKYHHDINSAFATPGAFNYNSPTRDSRFKNKFHLVQGDNFITMENGKIVIESSSGASRITLEGDTVTIDADIVVNGDLHVTGTGTFDTELSVAGQNLKDHTHTEFDAGGQTSGPNNA